MADRKLIEIKERILKYAMESWGITDSRNMDPVVDLLLDVFAYESARLHQDIKNLIPAYCISCLEFLSIINGRYRFPHTL